MSGSRLSRKPNRLIRGVATLTLIGFFFSTLTPATQAFAQLIPKTYIDATSVVEDATLQPDVVKNIRDHAAAAFLDGRKDLAQNEILGAVSKRILNNSNYYKYIRSVFVVDPKDYPVDLDSKGQEVFFQKIRAGFIAHLEIIFNYNEYYNTLKHLKNGMAILAGEYDKIVASDIEAGSGIYCTVLHEDTGEPCGPFFSVIYRAPDQEPINLSFEATKIAAEQIAAENLEKTRFNELKGKRPGDDGFQKLERPPTREYGLTLMDFLPTLGKLRKSSSKLAEETFFDLSKLQASIAMTVITGAAFLGVAWVTRGKGEEVEGKFFQKTNKAADRMGTHVANAFHTTGMAIRKRITKLLERKDLSGNPIRFTRVEIRQQLDAITEVQRKEFIALSQANSKALLGGAAKEEKDVATWFDPIGKRVKLVTGFIGNGLGKLPLLSKVSKDYIRFIKNHPVIGLTFNYGTAAAMSVATVKILDWTKFKPESRARLYVHGLVTNSFAESARLNASVNNLMGSGAPGAPLLSLDELKAELTKRLNDSTKDPMALAEQELNDAAAMIAGSNPEKVNDSSQVMAQALGSDAQKAMETAVPGPMVANAPDFLVLHKEDKPLSAVKQELERFLTKYRKSGTHLE